jgi:hypothetical protein
MNFLEWISLMLRTSVAVIFISYGINKLFKVKEFTVTFQSYQILPRFLSPMVARFLPITEVGLGSLLLLNFALPLVALLLGVLLILFSLLQVKVVLPKSLSDKPCGCGGSFDLPVKYGLIRNIILLGVLGATILIHEDRGVLQLNYPLILLLQSLIALIIVLLSISENQKQRGSAQNREGSSVPEVLPFSPNEIIKTEGQSLYVKRVEKGYLATKKSRRAVMRITVGVGVGVIFALTAFRPTKVFAWCQCFYSHSGCIGGGYYDVYYCYDPEYGYCYDRYDWVAPC